MAALLLGRHTERVHHHAGGVEPAHHRTDGRVLAGGVHRLQHHEQRRGLVGEQSLLQLDELDHLVGEQRLGLVALPPERVGSVTVAESGVAVDAELLEEVLR